MSNYRFFSLLFFLSFPLIWNQALQSQNLVPNAGFEEYVTDCPVNLNDLPLGWYSWRESPNSFSTCVDPQNLTDSLGWAPWTGFGWQAPYEGDSFIGLSAFSPNPVPGIPPEFREFIGCQLLVPMVVDSLYHVSFKTSLAWGNYFGCYWACNRLGVLFTMDGDFDWQENPFPVPNFSHVYSDQIISDTVEWAAVGTDFIADQPYTHMVMGVLFQFDSLMTQSFKPGDSSLGAYYFIDGVEVSPKAGVSMLEFGSGSGIFIGPNPASSEVITSSIQEIELINLFGTNGALLKSVHGSGNLGSLDIAELPMGLYVIEVMTALQTRREKLIVVR